MFSQLTAHLKRGVVFYGPSPLTEQEICMCKLTLSIFTYLQIFLCDCVYKDKHDLYNKGSYKQMEGQPVE